MKTIYYSCTSLKFKGYSMNKKSFFLICVMLPLLSCASDDRDKVLTQQRAASCRTARNLFAFGGTVGLIGFCCGGLIPLATLMFPGFIGSLHQDLLARKYDQSFNMHDVKKLSSAIHVAPKNIGPAHQKIETKTAADVNKNNNCSKIVATIRNLLLTGRP